MVTITTVITRSIHITMREITSKKKRMEEKSKPAPERVAWQEVEDVNRGSSGLFYRLNQIELAIA